MYVQTDLGDIIRIYNESFKNLRSCWANPMTLEWFMSRFGGSLKAKTGTAFIAEHENQPVGYVLVTTQNKPEVGLVAYISGVCVVPSYQRRGIGSKLVEKAMDWAKGEGAVLVENDDEIIENPVAVSFFEKLGFEIFHRGVCMSKNLTLPERFNAPNTHEVRELQVEDVDGVLRVRKEAFKEFGPWYSITNEEEFKDRMRSRIGRNDVEVFVAIKNGRPVGYVYCQIRESNRACGDIRNISVLPDDRRMGIGSDLMTRAFDFLRKNGVQIVQTVTETAEGFYEKMGFGVDARFVRVRRWLPR